MTASMPTAKLSPESLDWYKPQRPIREILADLAKPLPSSYLEQRTQGGATLTYVPWHKVVILLDRVAPGWEWEIRQMTTTSDRLIISGRLTIHAADGTFYREGMGTELLKEDKQVWVDHPEGKRNDKGKVIQIPLKDEFGRVVTEPRELAYGDVSSNAESQSFRRAAAKFGLALYLYTKD